jgi:hypothetical protein
VWGFLSVQYPAECQEVTTNWKKLKQRTRVNLYSPHFSELALNYMFTVKYGVRMAKIHLHKAVCRG